MDVEVIEFIVPTSNRKNLFVSNIPALDEDHIYATLYDSFCEHGLVYEIQVFPSTKVETGTAFKHASRQRGCYAFVKFFSYRSTISARKALDGNLFIGGAVCKVAFAKRRNTDKLTTTLHVSKCYELAAYYLGFNSWSSKITKMEEDRDCPQPDGGSDLLKVRFVCCVKLELAKQSLCCTGVGVWEETYLRDNSSLGSTMAKVRKVAHTRAIEDAFGKLVIISLSNGKTSVEVNTTRVEQVLADNQVDDTDLLQVNELEGVPDDQDDATTVDIDDVNVQLLQELDDSI